MAMSCLSSCAHRPQDMLAFEREKHARLNQVTVEVALRLHQVHAIQPQQQEPKEPPPPPQQQQQQQQQLQQQSVEPGSGDVLVLSKATLEKLGSRAQVMRPRHEMNG